MLQHINSILKVDLACLNNLLEQVGRSHLKLANKEVQQLKELSGLLQPFLEATAKTEGEKVNIHITKLMS